MFALDTGSVVLLFVDLMTWTQNLGACPGSSTTPRLQLKMFLGKFLCFCVCVCLCVTLYFQFLRHAEAIVRPGDRVDELEDWGQGFQNILETGEGDRRPQLCLLEDGEPGV